MRGARAFGVHASSARPDGAGCARERADDSESESESEDDGAEEARRRSLLDHAAAEEKERLARLGLPADKGVGEEGAGEEGEHEKRVKEDKP